jgi:hypothetical protein
MWWYRDSKPASPGRGRRGGAAKLAAPEPAATCPGGLAGSVALALQGRPRDPDCWVVMALLVDSRIELDEGAVTDGMTWLQAERTIAAALPDDPPRLYNRFARDFGDGWTRREALTAEERSCLDRARAALAGAPGVKSVGPRTQPAATR